MSAPSAQMAAEETFPGPAGCDLIMFSAAPHQPRGPGQVQETGARPLPVELSQRRLHCDESSARAPEHLCEGIDGGDPYKMTLEGVQEAIHQQGQCEPITPLQINQTFTHTLRGGWAVIAWCHFESSGQAAMGQGSV
ncbi:unnamed protein product [Boreogadus saida]